MKISIHRLIAYLLPVAAVLASVHLAQAQTGTVFTHRPAPNYAQPAGWFAPGLRWESVYTSGLTPTVRLDAEGKHHAGTTPDMLDYMHFLPQGENKGLLVVNHELDNLKRTHIGMGEGGGMSLLPIEWRQENSKWVPADTSRMVDFSPVGWTVNNCGGTPLANGLYLTAEEIFDLANNATTLNYSRDGNRLQDRFSTSQPEAGYANGQYVIPGNYPEFGGQTIAQHENFGFMVAVDPKQAKALFKCYHMGRFSHESAIVMPDNRTVYLTDDYAPAVFFKFVADKAGDFRAGNLYFFKSTGERNADQFYPGEWVQLPRELRVMLYAREEALKRGATPFVRLEWGVANPQNNRIYVCETGVDKLDLNAYLAPLGVQTPIAPHLRGAPNWTASEGRVQYPFGAVLEFRETEKGPQYKVLVAGGDCPAEGWNFASPDGISLVRMGSRDYLMIQEDLIGAGSGRMPKAEMPVVSDGYLLDLNIEQPQVCDLIRIVQGSPGAELTGACMDSKGTTLFLNNQHPHKDNQPPFNASATFAIQGFEEYPALAPQKKTQSFASNVLGAFVFSRPSKGSITQSGKTILTFRNAIQVKVAHLKPGSYQLQLENQPSIPFSVQ